MSRSRIKRIFGMTYLQVGILASLGVLICASVSCLGAIVLFGSLPPSSPKPIVTSTPLPPLKPLGSLALNKAEIETDLQVISPLGASPSSVCEGSTAPECFSASYTSDEGDAFVLVLTRYSNGEDASDFGFGIQTQLDIEKHATDVDIPTTAGNYRWLMLSFVGGGPTYHGGAKADNVAIYMVWSRLIIPISEEEAVQTFSRLLDRQIAKIRRN